METFLTMTFCEQGTLSFNHMYALLILHFGRWPYYWSCFSHILYLLKLKEKQERVVLVSFSNVQETTSNREWGN